MFISFWNTPIKLLRVDDFHLDASNRNASHIRDFRKWNFQHLIQVDSYRTWIGESVNSCTNIFVRNMPFNIVNGCSGSCILLLDTVNTIWKQPLIRSLFVFFVTLKHFMLLDFISVNLLELLVCNKLKCTLDTCVDLLLFNIPNKYFSMLFSILLIFLYTKL